MRRIFQLLVISLFFVSCQKATNQEDLFRIKILHDGYVVQIFTSAQPKTFYLSRSARDGKIHIPVRRAVVFSSTHIGFICRLDQQDKIIALPDSAFVCCDKLRHRMPGITMIGDELSPDFEQIIGLRPDVVFISGISPAQLERFKRLEQAGIAVVPILEYREQNPLARAKWIEVFGAFFDQYHQAKSIYKQIEKNYNSLKHGLASYLRKSGVDSPLVLVNIPYRGTWYVPGGQSYMANFVRDAGGRYPWADNQVSSSIPLSFEQVYDKAKDADILLNPNTATSIKQVVATDARLRLFRPVQIGQVYNFTLNKRQSCFAFWERGVVEPDRILSDLINIFYPQSNIASDTMFYYQKLK